MEVNDEDSICEALSDRIHQLFECGIQNIWMKATGIGKYQ